MLQTQARIQSFRLSIFLLYRNGIHAIGTLEGICVLGSLGVLPPEILIFTEWGKLLESVLS